MKNDKNHLIFRHDKNFHADFVNVPRRITGIETSWSVVTAMMLSENRIYDQLYVQLTNLLPFLSSFRYETWLDLRI